MRITDIEGAASVPGTVVLKDGSELGVVVVELTVERGPPSLPTGQPGLASWSALLFADPAVMTRVFDSGEVRLRLSGECREGRATVINRTGRHLEVQGSGPPPEWKP